MLESHLGVTAALSSALCWTITAVAFESAGKKVGSLCVNILRIFIAFNLLSVFNLFTRGIAFPTDASLSTWLWLLLSGLIGFVIGDLFLFQAYVEIGSRISQLIMSIVPPITAVTGYIIMREKITLLGFAGMIITISGIAMVILTKGEDNNKITFSHSIRGIIFAFIGALGQAFGLVFSKFGMGFYNPFAATQIRIVAAMVGFTIVISVTKSWGRVFTGIKNMKAMGSITIGSIFGPFVGVSMSLLAVQHAPTAIVSTITAITPILLIPVSIIIFKEKITSKEVLGSIVALSGIAILFI